MNDIAIITSYQLEDEFEEIKNTAISIVKMGFYKAAAHLSKPTIAALPSDPNSLESASYEFLKKFSQVNNKGVRLLGAKAQTFLRRPLVNTNRLLGHFSPITLTSNLSVISEARNKQLLQKAKLSDSTIEIFKNVLKKPDEKLVYKMLNRMGVNYFIPTTAAPSAPPIPTGNNELRFNLLKLKCIDPADWEITDFGENSINMGGMGADNVGQEIKVNQFFTNKFSEGESFTFSPKRRFLGFDLNASTIWPKMFNVTMAMAEKDADGGFLEFLQKLWGIIGDVVKELITAAAIAGVGAIIGTAVEPGVGTIIGAIVGAVIGAVVSWLLDSLKDDIFDPVPVSIIIPSQTSLFEGNRKTSPSLKTQFSHPNALYELTYEWELV